MVICYKSSFQVFAEDVRGSAVIQQMLKSHSHHCKKKRKICCVYLQYKQAKTSTNYIIM